MPLANALHLSWLPLAHLNFRQKILKIGVENSAAATKGV